MGGAESALITLNLVSTALPYPHFSTFFYFSNESYSVHKTHESAFPGLNAGSVIGRVFLLGYNLTENVDWYLISTSNK